MTQDEYSSDKSSDEEGMTVSLKEIPPAPVIRIPAVLKKALGYDDYLITQKKKVSRAITVFSYPELFILFINLYCSYINYQLSRISLQLWNHSYITMLRMVYALTFQNKLEN